MIIKSLSRKDTSFKQIVDYLFHDRGVAADFSYVHNMNIDPDDRPAIVEEFKANDAFRKKRKNGVVFYHEIISFNPEDTAKILAHPDMLRDITAKYLELRAPDAVAVARPHIEKKDHIHIHFVISACEKESSRTVRISKAQLEQIKCGMRTYQLECYPDIKHSYDPEREYQVENRRSHASWQMEERGQQQSKKERLKQLVTVALRNANSWEALTKELQTNDISLYHKKGAIAGIVWQQQKFRFTNLIEQETALAELTQSLDQHAAQAQEQAYIQKLKRQGKTFGVPKLPTDWERIRRDLAEMEKREAQYRQAKTQRKDREQGLDREL